MKKIILLTTALLSSVSVYGACNSTLDLGCRCQHPIINSEGKLACGEDYCAKVGKKCMSDGTCCESDKYCEVTKECCSENQTCDNAKGCIAEKDLKALCEKARGDLRSTTERTFCASGEWITWYDAKSWCESNGMEMVSVYDLCPSWNGKSACQVCPEVVPLGQGAGIWTDNFYGYDEEEDVEYYWSVYISAEYEPYTVYGCTGDFTAWDTREAFCR